MTEWLTKSLARFLRYNSVYLKTNRAMEAMTPTPRFNKINQLTAEIKAELPKTVALLEKLEAKNIGWELFFEESRGQWELGINTYTATWSWFWLGQIGGKEQTWFFKLKYSQNTGKTKKSFAVGAKVVAELGRQLGEVTSENKYSFELISKMEL